MSQQTWLITGAANGLGRDITQAALAAGHKVAAGARNLAQLDDLLADYPGQLLPLAMDVTDRQAIAAAVARTHGTFGAIDVLVNNAGYGHMLPFEQMSEDDFRAQVETNFFGVVDVTRAVLPGMRELRRGHIINISSVGGRVGAPGLAAYQSAKWAVGGFTEVLALETAPLGIRLTSLEPGGMRTNWAHRARGHAIEIMPDYEASVGQWMKRLAAYAGNEYGDPARVAQVVLKIAAHPAPPVHLLLGEDALHFYNEVEQKRVADAERWKSVTVSTGYSDQPVPDLPTT